MNIPGYQGIPGGCSDPATPGPYCLARCYCGTCPQYARQREQNDVLIEQEYQQRLYLEGQRAARREKHLGRIGGTTSSGAAA